MNLHGADLDALGYASIDWDIVAATAMEVVERMRASNAEKCARSYRLHIRERREKARARANKRYRAAKLALGHVVIGNQKKLTPAQVAELRASAESLAQLAARFGVSKQAVAYHRRRAA